MDDEPRPTTSHPASDDSRRAAAYLAVGATVGIGLAVAGALGAPRSVPPLSAGVVAVVNGHSIRGRDLERALSLLSQDSQRIMTEADRGRLLNRLIDEQLLVDRAVELGMLDSDRSVRKAIVQAMIEQVVLEPSARPPSDDEMRAYYRGHRDRLAPVAAARVRRAEFRRTVDGADPLARARRAAAAVAGGVPFDRVAAEMADPPLVELPDTLLPAAKLREYLGPRGVEALSGIDPGEITAPVAGDEGVELLALVERRAAAPPTFEVARPVVAALMERDAADAAMRHYLEGLRARARIHLASGEGAP